MTSDDVRRLRRLIGVSVAAAMATLLVVLVLPHDRYVRWQALRTEAYARLGWIYERIHDDPTPIDVAFIGTSHTMNGVDADAVQRDMAARGVRDPSGRCLTAVNFAVPNYGRSLAWVIARELIEHRKVKRVVLEVFENESRKPHPLFVYAADEADVLRAPLLINLNWAYDISRLPFRQASLFAKSLAPGAFGLKPRFDPADYDGSTVDNTRQVNVGGVALTPPLTTHVGVAELEKAAAENRAAKNTAMLGSRFAKYEYAFPLHYLDGILDLAKAKATPVDFLYLPGYGNPPAPVDPKPYTGRGDMIFANDILARQDIWHDVAHLNAEGAHALSLRLGEALSTRLPHGPAAGGCDFGRPPRGSLKPFHKL